MVRVGIKKEFEQYVHNAGLGPYLLDKCEQRHLLTESFVKGFTISLNFAYHCKLPYWGLLDEPPRAKYETFLSSLCYGETRGVTQGRIKSIHFPQFSTLHYLIGNVS